MLQKSDTNKSPSLSTETFSFLFSWHDLSDFYLFLRSLNMEFWWNKYSMHACSVTGINAAFSNTPPSLKAQDREEITWKFLQLRTELYLFLWISSIDLVKILKLHSEYIMFWVECFSDWSPNPQWMWPYLEKEHLHTIKLR